MSTGFVHSVKVPRLYKAAAKIIKDVCENGASLKSLVFNKNHPNVNGIYALTTITLRKGNLLDQLLEKTGLLVDQPRLDPWLARVLLTELLWGKGHLSSNCKPVRTVLSYEEQIRKKLHLLETPENALACENIAIKPRYVRVNTILTSVDEAISKFQNDGWSLLPTPATYSEFLKTLTELYGDFFMQDYHISELLLFPTKATFHDHAGYLEGQLILQDKASCLSAHLLNPKPGSVVLDMCAAPGMKTSHLAALMGNQGKIFAVEMNEQRCKTLEEQIALTNSTCVTAINKDALSLETNEYRDVEYVLVDPSCTGSGIIDRPPSVKLKEEAGEARLKSLRAFQVFLLRHALLNFPNVKRVVYSTCSVHPEENELVVEEVLSNVGTSYNLLCAKDLLGKEWINMSSAPAVCKDKCLRVVPHVDFCNGFFVAVFERNFDVPLVDYEYRKDSTTSDVTTEKPKRKRRGKKRKATADESGDKTATESKSARKKGSSASSDEND